MTQAADYTLIVGKTLNRAYIDVKFHSVLLRFNDWTWFVMMHPPGIDETIRFTGITGSEFLFDATILSVDIIDTLNVNITTNKGTAVFNSVLVDPNFIAGEMDTFAVSDVGNYDDNNAVRSVGIAETIKEIRYEVLSYDV